MLYGINLHIIFFFFSSRRRHTRFDCDWSSDVCSSDLMQESFVLAHEIAHIELGHHENPNCQQQVDADLPEDVAMWVPHDSARALREIKIGRASCRERV